MIPEDVARRLNLEGAFNVRDLGGYDAANGQTRWRVLLRGDSLHRLTGEDQQFVRSYGVRTVIDLRHENELKTDPNVFSQSEDMLYYHIPIIRGEMPGSGSATMPRDLGTVYRYFVDNCQDGLRETIVTIADAPQGGVLFHCAAGKDRTGVISMLLLGIAGVSPEIIATDYALTSEAMEKMAPYLMQDTPADEEQRAARLAMMTSNAPDMYNLIQYIDTQYGSIPAYLTKIGVSEDTIEHIRSRFVEAKSV